MERHEVKARIETQLDEWKRNLEIMKVKAEASTGETKGAYLETVSRYQKELDDLKIKAARTWDVADSLWDSASRDLERTWDEWQLDAKKVWNDVSK